MEPVQYTVGYRGYNNPRHNQKNTSGEQSIEGGKQLACGGVQLVNWPHATQDHRGVEDGIDPREAFDEMVTENTNPQGGSQQDEANQGVVENTLHE
jgi:hypothetical protein